VGAASALLIALLYVAIIALYSRVGAPPGSGEEWMAYLPGKIPTWWAILYLSVATDLLFLPVAVALYLALRDTSRWMVALAVAFVALFVAVDLAITWGDYARLLTLAERYLAATSDVQRAALVAAADAASAVLGSKLEVILAIVDLSLGILLVSWVMLRARFGSFTAWTGVVTGLLGIAALSGHAVVIVSNALCATAWLVSVSVCLWRLGAAGTHGSPRGPRHRSPTRSTEAAHPRA
jgi:hypothetical protein